MTDENVHVFCEKCGTAYWGPCVLRRAREDTTLGLVCRIPGCGGLIVHEGVG